MASVREPVVHPIAIEDLRPTQITVGMREVEAKRQAWRAKSDDKGAEFDRALEQALQFAKSMDAGYLPGWCGPVAR